MKLKVHICNNRFTTNNYHCKSKMYNRYSPNAPCFISKQLIECACLAACLMLFAEIRILPLQQATLDRLETQGWFIDDNDRRAKLYETLGSDR